MEHGQSLKCFQRQLTLILMKIFRFYIQMVKLFTLLPKGTIAWEAMIFLNPILTMKIKRGVNLLILNFLLIRQMMIFYSLRIL